MAPHSKQSGFVGPPGDWNQNYGSWQSGVVDPPHSKQFGFVDPPDDGSWLHTYGSWNQNFGFVDPPGDRPRSPLPEPLGFDRAATVIATIFSKFGVDGCAGCALE